MDRRPRFQKRIFLPILVLFLSVPLSACESLKGASAGDIARTFLWELPMAFAMGPVQVDGEWIAPAQGAEITIEQVNPSLGPGELTITGLSDGSVKGYANLKAFKDGHVTVPGRGPRSSGGGVKDKRGTLSKDKKRIDWDDGDVWIRPIKDVPNLEKDTRFEVQVYKQVEYVSGPEACRKVCLEQPDNKCGAYQFDFTQVGKNNSGVKACQLIAAGSNAARRKESHTGVYAGIIPENLSALKTGGTYVMRSQLSGRVLEVDGSGAKIYQKKMTPDAPDTQKWVFKLDGFETYTIQHLATKKYLMAERISAENGLGAGKIWLEGGSEQNATRFHVIQDGTNDKFKLVAIYLPVEEFKSDVLGLSFENAKMAFEEGPDKGPRLSLSQVYGGYAFQGRNNWEAIPHEATGSLIETDGQIDLLSQGVGFPSSFFLSYGVTPGIRDSFTNVGHQGIAELATSIMPDFVEEALEEVGDFVLPDDVQAVVPKTGRRTFTVPARARNVSVKVMAFDETISTLHFDDVATVMLPQNEWPDGIRPLPRPNGLEGQVRCIRTHGVGRGATPGELIAAGLGDSDVFDFDPPSVDTDCARWGANTIKTYNATDEIIYVMWTDEINWSTTNMVAGVMNGLLTSNAQNVNSSIFRYFAIAHVWEMEVPDKFYDVFKAAAICQKPKQATPVLTHSLADMAQNMADLGLIKAAKATKSARAKNAQKFNKSNQKAQKAGFSFFLTWVQDTAEQSDEYKATYRQYNPLLVAADYVGGDTKTIMAVNESLTKFWIIDSAIDDDWVITDKKIVRAKASDLTAAISDPGDDDTSDVISISVDVDDKESFGQCYTSWLNDVKDTSADIAEFLQ